jgi:benzil reductase ((S)-benzoin forming)
MDRAIVTGHTRGLGAAVAEDLMQRGFAVLGIARAGNDDLARRYGGALRQVTLDLADAGALQQWIASDTLERFVSGAQRALLVNNAGRIRPMGPAGRQRPGEIAAAVLLNIAAPLMLADAFVAATTGCRDRRIVHLSSGAGRNAYVGWSLYCASKAALDMHARATALDAIPHLAIESVAPGVIDTAMQAEVRAADARDFPLRDRFEAMHRDGQLTPPPEAARRFVDHVLAPAFGREPITDIRSLPR